MEDNWSDKQEKGNWADSRWLLALSYAYGPLMAGLAICSSILFDLHYSAAAIACFVLVLAMALLLVALFFVNANLVYLLYMMGVGSNVPISLYAFSVFRNWGLGLFVAWPLASIAGFLPFVAVILLITFLLRMLLGGSLLPPKKQQCKDGT